MENCIIKEVTFEQRKVLQKLIDEGKIKPAEGNKEKWLDNINHYPHISFLDGELSAFSHAALFEPLFKNQCRGVNETREVLFDDFIKEFA